MLRSHAFTQPALACVGSRDSASSAIPPQRIALQTRAEHPNGRRGQCRAAQETGGFCPAIEGQKKQYPRSMDLIDGIRRAFGVDFH